MRNPEGFGTWPFGEEWLWEAIATCYLPLLEVLGRAPITVSLTPVLCDQLEAEGALARCLEFLGVVRPESHRRDIEAFVADGRDRLVPELERSGAEYAAAAEALARLERSDGGLLAALGAHATFTSAATHAILPLLASDASVSLQVQTGIAAHRRRFGDWQGGFWLPECAHAPWLDHLLEEAGVRHTCVELTSVFGPGDRRHLWPLASDEGPVMWPIDRASIALVWGAGGYPASGRYRDYHRYTPHHHRVLANDGEPYDAAAARAQAREHGRDFVRRVLARIADGGVCVCALDTELLGHWWYEGVHWLAAVIDEAERQGLAMATLDGALQRLEPTPAPAALGVTSWGKEGDLRTWSGPAVAELAWRARTAELRLLSQGHASDRALRELLALQSSDWAFLVEGQLAGEYPLQRVRGHLTALQRAISGDEALEPQLRNLAPQLTGWGT